MAGRKATPTTNQNLETQSEETNINMLQFVASPPQTDVYHLVRKLGAVANDTAITADMVNDLVKSKFEAGYKLHSVHPLGVEPDGINLLYIFLKEGV